MEFARSLIKEDGIVKKLDVNSSKYCSDKCSLYQSKQQLEKTIKTIPKKTIEKKNTPMTLVIPALGKADLLKK